MVRTAPSSHDGRGGRQQNNSVQKGEPSTRRIDSGAPPNSGRSGATRDESSTRTSASAPRVDGTYRHQDRRSYESHHHTGGRDTGDRGRSNQHYHGFDPRDYGRTDQDYDRGHGNRNRRNDERPRESSWGQVREPRRDHDNYSHPRDHRDRQEYSSRNNCHGGDDSRRHQKRPKYGHQGHDNFYESNRQNYSAHDDRQTRPLESGSQVAHTQHERRPASAQNDEHQSYRHSTKPSPTAPIPPPAPSQGELSANDKLRQELEREELEIKIAKKRLEKEKIHQQLSQMKNSNTGAISEEVAQMPNNTQHLSETKNNDSVRSENVAARVVAKEPTDQRHDGTSQSIDADGDGGGDDDDDDDDNFVPATRKPAKKKKGTQRSVSQKKKTNRRITGQAKLSVSTKRKLREAQAADDEKMKHQLLKEYEEKMAASKWKNLHHYTEKDLMTSFTPKILDHYLMAGGKGKFLVEWGATPRKGSKASAKSDNCCNSWVSHEDFLFPALAHKYLSRTIHNTTYSNDSNEIEGLKLWIEDCEERERCLNCLNTYNIDDDEFDSHLELDFCCFLCKCKWNHPLKHSVRNCETGLKFHRGCCHGYQDLDAFESFVSPVGKVHNELLDLLDKNDGETESIENNGRDNSSENPDETVTEVSQGSTSVTVVDGDCGMFLQCLQSRSTMPRRKKDAVVLCINAGVGNAAVALKGLGIRLGIMIHVEADKVAQHVIRSNHDYGYGETEGDDGVKHIVELYESLADIKEDPEKVVRKYGPIDIVICSSPQGKSREESAQYAHDFLELIKEVKRSNAEVHQFHDHLFYLLESTPSIKDQLPLQGLSYCIQPKSLYVCNWPISCLQLPDEKKDALGLPQDDALHSVTNLYDSLRKSLCVGFDNAKWRDEIHPKFWSYLSLGPDGYNVKLNKGKFGLESFLLRLNFAANSEALSDVDYSKHLLKQSPSVLLLAMLLNPMKKLFNEKNYGPRYSALTTQIEQSEQSAAVHEHGGTSSPNSNDVSATASPVNSEVKEEASPMKEEELSTDDDEADLFDQVDESLQR